MFNSCNMLQVFYIIILKLNGVTAYIVFLKNTTTIVITKVYIVRIFVMFILISTTISIYDFENTDLGQKADFDVKCWQWANLFVLSN